MPRFYKIQTLLARFFWLDHKVIGLQYALTFLPLIGFSLAVLFRTRLSGLAGMRVKQDAIPGVEQRLWFTPTRTGEWEIACSQLCGLGHYRMRGFYTIQTQADFNAWLASQPAGL